jgi:hypothetical protein
MNPLPPTQALLNVARRVVWFKEPAAALADPIHFLAHVMTYGSADDVAVVRDAVGPEALREALDHAPPGVFDPRSWAYWQLMCFGRSPPPPMPQRSGVLQP